MQKQHITVTVKDIARAFWYGMETKRWAFFLTTLLFTAASIINLITPLFYKSFFDKITLDGRERAVIAPELVHVLIIILLLNLVAWLMYRGGHFILLFLESNVMARLKQISFDYLIDHSYGFFTNTFTGSLVQRVGRFSRSFERLCDTFLFTFLPLIIHVIGVFFIVWFQQQIIAMVISLWIVAVITFNYLFSRWKLKYDVLSASADSATTARLADTVGNQNAVASFSGSQYESEAFKEVSNKQARATQLTWSLSAVLDTVQLGLMAVVEFVVFYYATKYWQQGTISVGTFVLIQVYIIGLADRLWGFGRTIRSVYESIADSQEMVQILNIPHEVTDVVGAEVLNIKSGGLLFADVNFRLGGEQKIIEDVNLTIKGGEKIALIGPSGAGKSTLVKLLLRMYNLVEGKISIDGQDIQKVTQESLRNAISLVPQDPVLFHRTLLENIRYGRRDATDEEVISAAKLAHCDEFIDVLPLKYNTYVGERGIKLSGGERQRVAIARAILKNAPILILDEATSSLDSHSESLIQDALDKLMKGRTTLVIAHRLSTIRKMDRIIVMDNGTVTEEGTHDELLAKEKSLYKHLWNLQAGGFIAE